MAGSDEKEVIAKGPGGSVRWLVLADGTSPGREEFERLTCESQVKVKARCNTLAKSTQRLAKEMCRQLKDNVFELKLRHPPIRLFGVRVGDTWWITEVCNKPKKKQIKANIERADRLYSQRRK